MNVKVTVEKGRKVDKIQGRDYATCDKTVHLELVGDSELIMEIIELLNKYALV